MWNLFKKKTEKVNVEYVASQMNQRKWESEVTSEQTISVKGNYRNNRRSFDRLVLHIEEDAVSFRDTFGAPVTGVPQAVSQNEMYGVMKNILNVL